MNKNFIQAITIDWNKISNNSYLKEIPSISQLEILNFDNEITYFVGENGTGKSTLLEAIAVAYGFNPEGGTINYNFSTYDDVSELSNAIKISKGIKRPKGGYFFRAESFFNVASKLEDYRDLTPKEVFYERYGGKSLHEQSHGESFLSFFQTNEREGIYIMDEPEAALSPQRQLSLLIQISRMAKAGSQFIIATHSPILLGIPNGSIYSFDNEQINLCKYEETECYNVTKLFINDRESFIKRLLNEDFE
ncbi:AAA family ATPase [Candidatus Galacturonibacter soehngenii]|uniref:AAA family ATPase n=1 Tax=Candidatus Galacturonatibacter soehngenii TaxID=2307010 RepID=A0A7V7QL05_9FIRM|nr:AAA family ATPase [Candidatus Galacturonibacter soehngenii]KAB1438196.1 AAA family ATPase [Candidatus Galacturonibacter soehngenii]